MRFNKINFSIISIIALTLVLGACTSKGETQSEASVQPSITSSPSDGASNNKEINGLVNEVSEAKEEISKNNKLTEEEMLAIGREIRQKSMKDFYNLNNDADLDAFLSRYFIDEEPHY